MPADFPRDRYDRHTALGATAALCLALPTVALLALEASSARTETALWFAGTAVLGALVPLLYWAPYRAVGFAPFAALGWLAAVGHGAYWHEWPGWAHGPFVGLIAGACARARRAPEPLWETGALVLAVALGLCAVWLLRERGAPYDFGELFVLALSVFLVPWCWLRFFRPAFELTCEPLLHLMYRVRGAGPGRHTVPRTGPCIVVANHACWFDPLFLAKVLPRPVTPMMTARMYDLPFLKRLMVMFGVIRVPEKALKKNAPEIQEAIAALDRGECVVIFAEGYLRRSADKPLRRFGRGVWEVLKARPETPVFALWIEGAWGSYTSYDNGPPAKNKKKDFGRPIAVGMSASATVPEGVLADHWPTRIHLMNLVSAARAHAGVEPLPPFELPAKGDAESDEPAETV
jgi:1-acyl-sn-glycerol-3-phosphate acyltransferase